MSQPLQDPVSLYVAHAPKKKLNRLRLFSSMEKVQIEKIRLYVTYLPSVITETFTGQLPQIK